MVLVTLIVKGTEEKKKKENKIYLLGFDYKINAKHRFRFQTRFSDIKQDSSNQIPVEELKKRQKKKQDSTWI